MSPALPAAPRRSFPDLAASGPLLMLVASACFALMGLCVKYAASPEAAGVRPIPVGEIVFFRSLIATAVAAGFGLHEGWRLLGHARRMLLTRSLVGLASMYAYFYAIAQLKLGDAVLLTHLSPLIVAAMAPFVLGERSNRAVWVALAIGFAGVWVVEDPSGQVWGPGLIAGLASAFLAAGAYVSVRVLARTDSTPTIVLWFSAIAAAASGAQVLASGSWVPPAAPSLLALGGVGVFAALAQLLMTRAYAVGEAARVAVFGYATPVLAYLLGRSVLAEPVGWRGAAGCALLIFAGGLASLAARK